MDESFVILKDVSKAFVTQVFALQALSATFATGHMVGLAGPDGSGKTTLMRLIAGLLIPTTGSISVGGYDTIKDAQTLHRLIGYMPQKFGLYEDLTVSENLNLYADLRGVTGSERKHTFSELMEFTGLAPFTKRLAGALSGGMKQKLGLACTLLCKPKLLLLDEPSVGVDPISRRELWKMVRALVSEDVCVIWSTAYLDEAEKCDTVLLLHEGQLLYYGVPQQLTEQMEGYTFKLTHLSGNRRQILEKALRQPAVSDGVIQGSDIRLVFKDTPPPPLATDTLSNNPQTTLTATEPRFEDAFISKLGGGPGGVSQLAEVMPFLHDGKAVAVEANALTKRFGSFTAADDVTFQIQRGEIFGLLGPNGAGKSTTFKMMCGLLKPTSGTAYVQGLDLQKAPGEARAHIGYMAQKFSLYGTLSVRQNLDFFAGIYNLGGAEKQRAVEQMISIFNFKAYLNDNADLLPLGFKQRLALACAVMHRPEVLFLDEPTSGVDPITRREFWNHINGLVEKGVTVMVTTHFMDEAEYCDRVALIYRSRIIEMGSPQTLKEAARTEQQQDPTLEDAFIHLIEQYNAHHALS
jgi:ABC-2 type transport system ATP-binding protein